MNLLHRTLLGVNELVSPLLNHFTKKAIQGKHCNGFTQIMFFSKNTKSLNSFPKQSSLFRQCPVFIGDSQILTKTSSIFSVLPQAEGINQQVRTYKVKLHPKRRCKGCYFVKRHGRLFVECNLKPRHKQMEFQTKDQLWREDYSKGAVKRAAFWNWSKENWYRRGDNQWARFDWLQGKYDS